MKQTFDIPSGSDYSEKYQQLSDEKLKDILINREQYQPQAAQAAIHEAIRRKLIHSEQDLFSPDYQPEHRKSSLFFPNIYKEEQKLKLKASLHRILYIIGLLPLSQAWQSFRQHEQGLSILFAVFSAIWLLLVFLHSKNNKNIYQSALGLMLTVATGFTIYRFSESISIYWIDILITSVSCIIPLYVLFFIRNLNK